MSMVPLSEWLTSDCGSWVLRGVVISMVHLPEFLFFDWLKSEGFSCGLFLRCTIVPLPLDGATLPAGQRGPLPITETERWWPMALLLVLAVGGMRETLELSDSVGRCLFEHEVELWPDSEVAEGRLSFGAEG